VLEAESDQFGVPAISNPFLAVFICWEWRPAKPRTGKSNFYFVTALLSQSEFQFGAAQDCGEIFLAMAFGHYMASIPNLKDAFHIIIRNDSSEQGREPSQNM
jgi:hypothetical protein